jgi:hypothetical protein
MEFRLLYEGPLGSRNSSGHVQQKHAIRKALHKQLAKLWERNEPGLDYLRTAILPDEEIVPADVIIPARSQFMIGGFQFSPLIMGGFHLTCALDVLFLRREDPSTLIVSGGDIDNRIKTLFDALRMPKNEAEIRDSPEEDENPFFCLLEDDCLITEIKVTADQLLVPLKSGQNENDVVLIIGVHVRGWEDLGVLRSRF